MQPVESDDDLFEELWAVVVAGTETRASGEHELALVAHALAAAVAVEPEERAWALTALGSTLRALEHHHEALQVLQVSLGIDASPKAQLAASTCAVAVLCDLGRHEEARSLGERVRARHVDATFLRALGRVYFELSLNQDDGTLRSLSDSYFRSAELEEARTGSV